jgi:hypothetical protein
VSHFEVTDSLKECSEQMAQMALGWLPRKAGANPGASGSKEAPELTWPTLWFGHSDCRVSKHPPQACAFFTHSK